MIIALMGVDGSGKTTLSYLLKNLLEKKNKKVLVVKVFDYLILRYFLKVIKVLVNKKLKAHGFPAEKNKKLVFKLWPLVAYFDNLLFYLIKIWPLKFKYDYVICDRYFYDMAVSYSYLGFSTKWLYNLYIRIIPEPKYAFILDVNPEIAFRRAKEFDLNYFIEQRELYLDLVRRKNFQLIDASPSPEQISDIIENKIKGY